MKKFYALCMLLSCSLCNAATDAVKAPVASQEKKTNMVGVVANVQDIILKTKVDKDPVDNLLKLQQEKQNELKKLGEDIQKREQELQTKASTLSPDALKRKQEELEEMRQKAQLKLQRANNELREAEMKTRAEVFQKVQEYAQQWLDANSAIDIVFEMNGGILASSKKIDSTSSLSDFIKKDLDKKEAKKAAAKAPAKKVATKK